MVAKKFINQFFCFITAVAQPFIVEERSMERETSVGQMVMCPKFIHRQLLGCEKAYAHLNFKSYRKMHSRRGTLMSPFELWHTNMAKRRYDSVTFNPMAGEVSRNQFNTWRGLSTKAEDAVQDLEDEKLWGDHILNVWADGDVNLAEKIHAWFATLIKKPGT